MRNEEPYSISALRLPSPNSSVSFVSPVAMKEPGRMDKFIQQEGIHCNASRPLHIQADSGSLRMLDVHQKLCTDCTHRPEDR